MIAAFWLTVFVSGYVLVVLLLPLRRCSLLKAPLALGLGIAFSAFVLFFSYLLFGPGLASLFTCDALALGALSAAAYRVLRRRTAVDLFEPDFGGWQWGQGVAFAAFCLVLLGGVGSFGVLSFDNPYGWADAIALWNAHAKLLSHGTQEAWRGIFSNRWVWHADYPLLLPAAIAHGWRYVGSTGGLVPISIAGGFLFGTAGLLMASLYRLRGALHALLAGTMLLGSPLFIYHGASQYADIPLSFFALAAFVAIAIADRLEPPYDARLLILAGLSSGCALWTKNEGALLLASLLAARFVVIIRSQGFARWCRELGYFAAGLAPVLAVIVYFKTQLSGPNYWVTVQVSHLHAIGLGLGTSVTAATVFFGDLTNVGSMIISAPLLLAVYLVFAGVRIGPKGANTVWSLLLALGMLVLVPAYIAFVFTPRNLDQWHRRLLMQLWPSALFLYFLIAGTPGRFSSPGVGRES